MSPRARRLAWAPLLAAWLGSTGCAAGTPSGDTTTTNVDGERQAIAAMHVSKCGACHVRPEPRTRTREHLEDALARHRKRLRLTSAEWDEMIDYLAMPPGNTARETR